MSFLLKPGKKIAVEEPVAPTPEPSQPRPTVREDNRFYLPVLHFNAQEFWPAKPEGEPREKFEGQVAYDTCLGKCCGVSGLKGACCQLDPDDLEHVLGPVSSDDINRIIASLKKAKMKPITREDVVIDFDEGKLIGEKWFNGHPVFADPKTYPILRMQLHGVRFACKFLNTKSMKCTIYENRPLMCRGYYCEYIKANFLVKVKSGYQKVR